MTQFRPAVLHIAVLEARAPSPFPVNGATDPGYVVARMTWDANYRYLPGDPHGGWRLHVLPDTKYGPDFLMQSGGQYLTTAHTTEQASDALFAAAEAIQQWAETNDQAKTALQAALHKATQMHAEPTQPDTQDPPSTP